jgi:ethanolamine permease
LRAARSVLRRSFRRAVSYNNNSLTANIVTMSVFGAIVMYIVSMAALFKLRRAEPLLERPYRVPFLSAFPHHCAWPGVSLRWPAMIYYNAVLFGVFRRHRRSRDMSTSLTKEARESAPLDEMLEAGK